MPDDERIYPYRLMPVIKDKLWGGRNLEQVLGKTLPPGQLIGETWEAWEGCLVENGMFAGKTLQAVIDEDAVGVLGTAAPGGRRFPLLFKFIDAQDDLSVQVHPDDAQARVMENYPYGKTEAWYILHAAPDAKLILGFNRPLGGEEVAYRIHQNTLIDVLASVTVERGDVLFVPAGTVHAIGRGIVLAEIQENSDITFRLYDWGREAKGRELHIDQSLRVLDYFPLAEPRIPALTIHHPRFEQSFLVACRYFSLELLEIWDRTPPLSLNGRFHILTPIRGDLEIGYGAAGQLKVDAKQAETFVLPAQLGAYTCSPKTESCQVLRAYVPDLDRDVVAPLRRADYDVSRIERLGGSIPEHNDLLPFLRR